MAKNVGLTYVKDFEFPSEQGFTGSAGKHNVRGYYRGGAVKKDPVKAAAQKPRAPGPGAARGGYLGDSKKGMPKGVKARGGTVGVTTPRRGKSMPQQGEQEHYAAKSAKKGRGGKMDYAEGGSVHDKLKAEGAKMGYAYGGTVKNTSAEFVQTRGKQDTMDHANFPVVNESSQRDKESGPRKERRPRFNYGGKVRQVRAAPEKRRKASGKGMPKGVKARGGLAAYANGGAIEILGKGAARDTADRIVSRANRMRSTLDEATEALQSSTRTTQTPTTVGAVTSGDIDISLPPAPPQPVAPAKPRKPAPGSERGKRKHYGLPFQAAKIDPEVVEAAGGGVVSAAKGGKNWIAGAIKKPGALRASMGVKKGQKIPAKKLATAAKKSGVTGRRARLAQTLKKMG